MSDMVDIVSIYLYHWILFEINLKLAVHLTRFYKNAIFKSSIVLEYFAMITMYILQHSN